MKYLLIFLLGALLVSFGKGLILWIGAFFIFYAIYGYLLKRGII
ncbi:MAG: hypothetical protein QW575_07330 [Thermoproteota archaeon]